MMPRRSQDSYYAYDEWDYVLADYRRNWCRLREVELAGDDGDFYRPARCSATPRCCRRCAATSSASGPRPIGWCAGWKTATNSISIALIEIRVARMMGESPRPARLQRAQKRVARRRHALPARHVGLHRRADPSRGAQGDHRRRRSRDDWMKAWQRRPQQSQRPRRIIDVNKEALVIMAQALEEIGDSYAIMGFSGHGRDNVEFYVIKEFEPGTVRRGQGAHRLGRAQALDPDGRGDSPRAREIQGRQLARQAHDPAERRIPAGLRLRSRPALQRLRHPGHDGGAEGTGDGGGAAVLHHGRSHRPRLSAPDVPALALPGDRGHHLAAAQLPKIYEQIVRW